MIHFQLGLLPCSRLLLFQRWSYCWGSALHLKKKNVYRVMEIKYIFMHSLFSERKSKDLITESSFERINLSVCTYVQPESQRIMAILQNKQFFVKKKTKSKLRWMSHGILEEWWNKQLSVYKMCCLCFTVVTYVDNRTYCHCFSKLLLFADLQNNLFFIWKFPAQLSVFIWHETKVSLQQLIFI